MGVFEIRDAFYLKGQPFKILSGAIHYFRIDPADWYHSLYNLKALGFNTVETYVPWNAHEPRKGQFDFSGRLDLERFIQTAQSLGLYMIVRPSPFICAEWEFGGLPAWLLEEDLRIRSSDPAFIEAVDRYYDRLLGLLTPYQVDQGGPILMMQVENEYGSYGEDKDYLRAIRDLMKEKRRDLSSLYIRWTMASNAKNRNLDRRRPLCDGKLRFQRAYNFGQMQEFFSEYGKKWPLMCMEFWDGWFNRWKEPIIKRDPEELAEAVHEVLQEGSINLYMFHGGTNFGFMNGCSARGSVDLPQVTSYDYDALLDEQGNPTPKYYAVKKMMATYYPEYPQMDPLVKSSLSERTLELTQKTSLFGNLNEIAQVTESLYPQTMEEIDHPLGYLLYETEVEMDAEEERLRIIDARDRVQVYANDQLIATQYQEEIGQDLFLNGKKKTIYKSKTLDRKHGKSQLWAQTLSGHPTKRNPNRGLISIFISSFIGNNMRLILASWTAWNFSKEWQEGQPAFYQFAFI